MKLGKLPARPDAIKFKLQSYIDETALPTPPLRFGHYSKVTVPWGELGNDVCGDCVWAGSGHETMTWRAAAGSSIPSFTPKEIISSYSDVTGYDGTDATDYGTDVQQACSYRQKTGITDGQNRYKIDSYVALRVGDVNELVLATYLFGVAGIGIEFPLTAWTQFRTGQPWDIAGPSRIDGGHYIPCVGRNSKGNFLVVTWGRLQAMTPRFYAKYSDEAVAYVSLDSINSTNLVTPEGFDIAKLRRNLAAL